MRRTIVAFALLLASAATASAQGLFPSVWQTQRGGLLKVLSVDPAGNFSGIFISSPTVPVPGFPITWLDALSALGWSFRRRGTGRRIAT
jgi:hypothetical protein